VYLQKQFLAYYVGLSFPIESLKVTVHISKREKAKTHSKNKKPKTSEHDPPEPSTLTCSIVQKS
jgi:hypothetical protein